MERSSFPGEILYAEVMMKTAYLTRKRFLTMFRKSLTGNPIFVADDLKGLKAEDTKIEVGEDSRIKVSWKGENKNA